MRPSASSGLVLLVTARLRRRAAAVLALALLAALGTAVTVAAGGGARRTATVLDRALDEDRVADVAVDVADLDDERLAATAALPEVAELSAVAFTALRPAGTDLAAGIDLAGIAPLDERAGQTMDRLRVVEGRLPTADQADEVAIDPGLARRLDLDVGDDLDLESYRQGQLEDLFVDPGGVTADGPAFTAEVVGTVRSLEEVTSDNQGRFSAVLLSPAGWREYGTPDVDRITDADRAGMGSFRILLRARLAHGAADASAYLDGLERIFGREIDTTFSQSRPDVFAAASDTLEVEARALALLALGAALAAAVAVGQASARLAASLTAADRRALAAVGATRAEQAVAGSIPAVLAVAVGGLLGVGLGVASTSAARFGLADRVEVDRGLVVDPLVVLIALATLTLVAGAAAWRAASAATHVGSGSGLAPARWPERAPAVAMGISTARARAWWPTLVIALAVTAVTALATFGASLDHLAGTPALYGFGWDEAIVLQADGEAIAAREGPVLAADERVSGLSLYRIFEISFGGDRRLGGLAVETLKGEAAPSVLDGRLPSAVGEIAVDPGALPGAGPAIGDVLRTPDLSDDTALEVVGILTGTGLGGFVVDPETADALHADVSEGGFLLRWADDVEVDAAEADLADRFAEVEPPRPTAQILNLRGVRGVPVALGAFFLLIGLATVAHAMVLAGRRRRQELAVTQALGFTPRQAAGVLVVEGLAIGVVGLVVGIVLGLLAGRLVWAQVADGLDVLVEVAVPSVGVVAVGLLAVAVLAVLGAAVARTIVRGRPARTLRVP